MTPDPRRLLVELRLAQLLAELEPGWPRGPLLVEAAAGGRTAALRLGPAGTVAVPAPSDPLSPCQRDVLAVVRRETARLGRRVRGAEVRAAVRADGHRWGDSTINVALADLTAAGLLLNAGDKRGYGSPVTA